MVYDLPQDAAKRNFAHLKREAQHKRAMYYIEKVDAPHVFPMAGPPMFLRDELFRYNGLGQRERLDLHRPGRVPRADEGGSAAVRRSRLHPGHRRRARRRRDDGRADALLGCRDRARCSTTSGATSRSSAPRARPRSPTKRPRAPPMLPPDEMLAALKEWWEPLLRRGRIFRDGVGGPVRYTIGELDMVRRLPQGEGARVRGGGDQLLVHHPRRPRLDEHPRPRDRLVELDLPVDAVRARVASASSTSSSTRS